MKNNKSLFILVFMAVILLAGCTSPAKKLVGVWDAEDGSNTFTFYDDGAVLIRYNRMTEDVNTGYYEVDKQGKNIRFDTSSGEFIVRYSLKDNELILFSQEGEYIVLHKR